MGTLCRELCKNGCTDRDALCDAESGAPMNHVLDEDADAPMGRGTFRECLALCKA